MSAPHFDFIHPRHLNPWWGLAVLGLAALLLSAMDAREALLEQRLATQQMSVTRHRLQRLQARIVRVAAPTPSISPDTMKQVNALLPVANQLAIPWPDWLVVLREATGNNAAILKLSLKTDEATAIVSGEAKTFADITALMQQLAASPKVKSVSLLEHHQLQTTPGMPTAFEVSIVFSHD